MAMKSIHWFDTVGELQAILAALDNNTKIYVAGCGGCLLIDPLNDNVCLDMDPEEHHYQMQYHDPEDPYIDF